MQAHKKTRKVRQVPPAVDSDQLSKDLEALRQSAIEAGAWDAAVVSLQDLVFDDSQPGGDRDYKSAHWPLSYPKDDMRQALEAFGAGIFFRVKTPPEAKAPGQGTIIDKQMRRLCEKIYAIAAAVESDAFYMGHHLAVGLAVANCRAVYCFREKRCWAAVKGQVCRHPYKARPSMAAAGLDPAAMAKKQKWKSDNQEMGPLLAGLVMVR